MAWELGDTMAQSLDQRSVQSEPPVQWAAFAIYSLLFYISKGRISNAKYQY